MVVIAAIEILEVMIIVVFGILAVDGMLWVCSISNAVGPVEVREAPSPARIACGLVRVIDTGSVNTGLLRADWVKNA